MDGMGGEGRVGTWIDILLNLVKILQELNLSFPESAPSSHVNSSFSKGLAKTTF